MLKYHFRETKFVDAKPGNTWLNKFLARHPDVKLRKANTLEEHRARLKAEDIKRWFTECEETLEADGVNIKDIPAAQIFNCDETGFALHSQETGMILFLYFFYKSHIF